MEQNPMNSFIFRVLVMCVALALVSSCSSMKPGGQLAPIDLTPAPGPAGQSLPGGGAAGGSGGGSTSGGGIAPPAPSVDPAPDFDPKGFFAQIHQATGVQCVDNGTKKAHLHIKGQVQKFISGSLDPTGCCSGQVLRAIDDGGRYIDVDLKTISGKEGLFDFDFYPGVTHVNGHKTINVDLMLADTGFVSPLLDTQQLCCSYCNPNYDSSCLNGLEMCGGNGNWLILMGGTLTFTVDQIQQCNPSLLSDPSCSANQM